MTSKEKWIKRTPKLTVSILLLITIYMLFRTWLVVFSMLASQCMNKEIHFYSSLFGSSGDLSIFWLVAASGVSTFTWLLSTRVKSFTGKWMRLFTFILPMGTVAGSLIGFGMTLVKLHVIPFFEQRLTRVIDTNVFIDFILFEQTGGFFVMLIMLPMIMLVFIAMYVSTKYLQHEEALNKAFFEFEWRGKWLRKFSEMEGKELYPDIELGLNTKTNEMVILPGFDRTLNTTIVGSIGTGKTAALGLPILNQDLHHMTKFINEYPKLIQLENYKSEDVSGRYLNGISVIEPSNDLCQKMYRLCKAHNIPDKAITYIDPTNPDTPSINPMRGPVDKIAEVFTQVIAGLSDSGSGGNFYFEQAQRSHLKYHIYLLKMHDENKEVTFDMLLEMYDNTNIVHEMHQQLKTRFPSNIDDIENKDERNFWKILKGIDDWFNNNLVPEQVRQGPMMVTNRDSNGNVIYEDLQAKDVKGLRNILNDIGSNPLIRRVLFGKSDFDFDTHMAKGGILLVNTAKGELEALNSVLGKIVLMTLQNASFRRAPNISPYHHIFIDEAPEYLYNSFKSFPAQSRKYKVVITTLQQTIAQLADAFGEHYMTTLIAAMRNRMVYGDVPSYDAKYFSDMFGERDVYEEGESEQSVSPLQDNPMTRSGSTYSKVRQQNKTAGDIMYQDAFQCAVKIVVKNKPIPVQQIKANFVPSEEFETAIHLVNDKAADEWLADRRAIEKELDDLKIESIEETELINKEFYDEEQKARKLNPEVVEKATSIQTQPRPASTVVNYGINKQSTERASTILDIAPSLDPVVTRKDILATSEIKESHNTEVIPETKETSGTSKTKAELLFSKVEVPSSNAAVTETLNTDNIPVEENDSEPLIESKQPVKPINPLLRNVAKKETTSTDDVSMEQGKYTATELDKENKQFLEKIQNEIR